MLDSELWLSHFHPTSHVVDIIHAPGMKETYATYVDDECFDIHDYDDTDDNIDDDTHDDTDDDTDDVGRGNRTPLLGRTEFVSQMMIYDETLILDLVLARMSILEGIRT